MREPRYNGRHRDREDPQGLISGRQRVKIWQHKGEPTHYYGAYTWERDTDNDRQPSARASYRTGGKQRLVRNAG